MLQLHNVGASGREARAAFKLRRMDNLTDYMYTFIATDTSVAGAALLFFLPDIYFFHTAARSNLSKSPKCSSKLWNRKYLRLAKYQW